MGVNGKTITLNGVSSDAYNLHVTGGESFDAPAINEDTIEIPGRNGALHKSNDRYDNVDVKYTLGIVGVSAADFDERARTIRSWLLSLSEKGYVKLEDERHPNIYRMAHFAGPITIQTIYEIDEIKAGTCDVTFSCKPQIFLNSGDTVSTFSASGTITNPSFFKSNPLLRVYGKGQFTVGSGVINIATAGTAYIDIDCDNKNATEGSDNRNSNIEVTSWPELVPGDNTVTLGDGITKIEVTPRWWML
jgi:phage-related protein